MAEALELVPVREAARLAGVDRHRVYTWLQRGLLAAEQGRYGQVVRLSAVQALAAEERTPHQVSGSVGTPLPEGTPLSR